MSIFVLIVLIIGVIITAALVFNTWREVIRGYTAVDYFVLAVSATALFALFVIAVVFQALSLTF